MRRILQKLSDAEAVEILRRGTTGVLGLADEAGQPYTVPLNYVYHEGHIYFHCAAEGKKLELIRRNPKVSFCVIGRDTLVPEKWTTRYESVIVTGTARQLETRQEKRDAMLILMGSLLGSGAKMPDCMGGDFSRMAVVDITVTEMTGKRSED